MKTGLHLRRFLVMRASALAGVLLLPAVVFPAAAAAEDELPAAPAAKLQLQGTLASLNVAPTKLDNGPGQVAGPPPALQIAILEGEDVSNNIKERTAREPIVQVTDENHKPVAGVAVLFSIDSQGGHAGATFLHGAKTFTGTTDAQGKVSAQGFHPNGHAGQFHINVSASKGQLNAHTVIAQANIAAATASATSASLPGFVATHVVVVSLVAAGVVVGGMVGTIVATNSPVPTAIGIGTGSVGAPALAGGVKVGAHR